MAFRWTFDGKNCGIDQRIAVSDSPVIWSSEEFVLLRFFRVKMHYGKCDTDFRSKLRISSIDCMDCADSFQRGFEINRNAMVYGLLT